MTTVKRTLAAALLGAAATFGVLGTAAPAVADPASPPASTAYASQYPDDEWSFPDDPYYRDYYGYQDPNYDPYYE